MKPFLASLPILAAHLAAVGIVHASQEGSKIKQPTNHPKLGFDHTYVFLAQRQVTIRPVISTSVGLTTVFSNGLSAVVPTNIVITLTPGTTILPSLSSSFTSPQSQIDGSVISSTKVIFTTSGLVSTSIKESILTLTSFAPTTSSSSVNPPKTTLLSSSAGPLVSFVPIVTGTSTPTPTSVTKPRIVPAAVGYTYFGCYTEGNGVRALNGTFWPDDANTVEKCAVACSPFKYAGNEYGRECWCGDELSGSSVLAPDSQCVMPCPGNPLEYCGGSIRMSVYVRDGASSGSHVSVSQSASSTSMSGVASSISTSYVFSTSSLTLSSVATSLSSSTGSSLQTSTSSASKVSPSSSSSFSSSSSSSSILAISSFTLPSSSSTTFSSTSSNMLSKPPTVISSSLVSTSKLGSESSTLSKSLSVSPSQISTTSSTFSTSTASVITSTKVSSTTFSAALASDSPTPSPGGPTSVIVDNGSATTLSYTVATITQTFFSAATVTSSGTLSPFSTSKIDSTSVAPSSALPITYNSSPINTLPSTISLHSSSPSQLNPSISVKTITDIQSSVVTYSFTRPVVSQTSTMSLVSIISIYGPSTRSVYVYSPPTLNCPTLTPATVTVTQILTVTPSSIVYTVGVSSQLQGQNPSISLTTSTAIPNSLPTSSGSATASELPLMPWMSHSNSHSKTHNSTPGSHTHTISRSILNAATVNGTAPITTLSSGRFVPGGTGATASATANAGAPLSKVVNRKMSIFLVGVIALRIFV